MVSRKKLRPCDTQRGAAPPAQRTYYRRANYISYTGPYLVSLSLVWANANTRCQSSQYTDYPLRMSLPLIKSRDIATSPPPESENYHDDVLHLIRMLFPRILYTGAKYSTPMQLFPYSPQPLCQRSHHLRLVQYYTYRSVPCINLLFLNLSFAKANPRFRWCFPFHPPQCAPRGNVIYFSRTPSCVIHTAPRTPTYEFV